MPKNSGMLAKRTWEDFCTFLIVTTPMAEMITPPAKLASGEKHI
jgi:hypothetical protein